MSFTNISMFTEPVAVIHHLEDLKSWSLQTVIDQAFIDEYSQDTYIKQEMKYYEKFFSLANVLMLDLSLASWKYIYNGSVAFDKWEEIAWSAYFLRSMLEYIPNSFLWLFRIMGHPIVGSFLTGYFKLSQVFLLVDAFVLVSMVAHLFKDNTILSTGRIGGFVAVAAFQTLITLFANLIWSFIGEFWTMLFFGGSKEFAEEEEEEETEAEVETADELYVAI